MRENGFWKSLFGVAMAVVGATAWASPLATEAFRQAVSRGEVVPLAQVLREVEREFAGGHLLEAEVEEKPWAPARWVYEVRWLTGDGRVVKRYYDATTGRLLRDVSRPQ